MARNRSRSRASAFVTAADIPSLARSARVDIPVERYEITAEQLNDMIRFLEEIDGADPCEVPLSGVFDPSWEQER
ncbi:hypothetical protein BH23CHL5_BH23CHL5_00200 [soil metagenome]